MPLSYQRTLLVITIGGAGQFGPIQLTSYSGWSEVSEFSASIVEQPGRLGRWVSKIRGVYVGWSQLAKWASIAKDLRSNLELASGLRPDRQNCA